MRSRRSWFLPCAIVVALALSAVVASNFLACQYFGLRLAAIEHRGRALAWAEPDAASKTRRSSVAAALRPLDLALERLVPSEDGAGAPWTWDPDPCRIDTELIAQIDPLFEELAHLLDRDDCRALLRSPGALGIWPTQLAQVRNWANLLCARALCAGAIEGDEAECARWLGRALDLVRLFDDGTQCGGAISMCCEGIVLSAVRVSLCGLRTDAEVLASELEPRLRHSRFGRDLAEMVRRDSRATRHYVCSRSTEPFSNGEQSSIAMSIREYTVMLDIVEQQREHARAPSPEASVSHPRYLDWLALREQRTGLACAALLIAVEHQRSGVWPDAAPAIEGLDLRYTAANDSVTLSIPAATNVSLMSWSWQR